MFLETLKATLQGLRRSFSAKADVANNKRDAKGSSEVEQAYAEGEGHAYAVASDEVRTAERGHHAENEPELSQWARFALRTLRNFPGYTRPHAIANGPYSTEQMTTLEDVSQGLVELEGVGLAREDDGGVWQLTELGRSYPLA